MTYRISSTKVDGKTFRIINHTPECEAWNKEPSLRLSSHSSRGIGFTLSTTFDGRRYRFDLPRAMVEELVKSLTDALKDSDEYNRLNPVPENFCWECGCTNTHYDECSKKEIS